jgi:hypothetical protein
MELHHPLYFPNTCSPFVRIWEVKWMMKFHPDKCQVLAITKKKTTIKKNYNLHDHTLEHVPSAKYLGVTITSDFWKQLLFVFLSFLLVGINL